MPYAIKRTAPRKTTKVRSAMPTEGVNELVMSQILSPSQGTKLLNYFIRQETELKKRGGVKRLAKVDNTERPVLFVDWTDTLFMIAYANTLAVFNLNTSEIFTIKDDFSENITDGERYGLDFYSCNSKIGEVIYKTTLPTLAFNSQTTDFSLGKTVTGQISGKTAKIVGIVDSGATGTLTLDNIDGAFINGEALLDELGGNGNAVGTVDYANTGAVVASAGTVPRCEALALHDKSLVAINTDNDISENLLSRQNAFTDWDHTQTELGAAYSIIYSFAGEATDSANFQSESSGVQSYGNVLVAGYKDGYAGFERSTKETAAGTSVQVFTTVFEKLNDGMEKNSLSTPLGIAFGNENGAFMLLANSNGARIEFTQNISRERKANFDFTDCDFAWSSFDNRLYVTLREKSGVNNLILWFNTKNLQIDEKGRSVNLMWGEVPYGVARFFTKGNKVYGIASTSPRVLDMFSEDQLDDEGIDIDYDYKQPMNAGAIESIKDWLQLDLGGDISPGGPITVNVLGVLEEGGEEVQTGLSYSWISGGSTATESELSTAEMAVSGMVAEAPAAKPVWTPMTGYKKLWGYSSYVLQFVGADKLPHTIRLATATIVEGRNQRKNILTQN